MSTCHRSALARSLRIRRPRHADIDWARTLHANLRHYQPQLGTVVPEKLVGFGRRARHPDLPDTPIAWELAKDAESRQLLDFTEMPFFMALPFAAPLVGDQITIDVVYWTGTAIIAVFGTVLGLMIGVAFGWILVLALFGRRFWDFMSRKVTVHGG